MTKQNIGIQVENNSRYIPQKDDVFNAIVRVGNVKLNGELLKIANKVAIGCPCICLSDDHYRIISKEKNTPKTMRIFNFRDFTFAKVVNEINKAQPTRKPKNG